MNDGQINIIDNADELIELMIDRCKDDNGDTVMHHVKIAVNALNKWRSIAAELLTKDNEPCEPPDLFNVAMLDGCTRIINRLLSLECKHRGMAIRDCAICTKTPVFEIFTRKKEEQ